MFYVVVVHVIHATVADFDRVFVDNLVIPMGLGEVLLHD